MIRTVLEQFRTEERGDEGSPPIFLAESNFLANQTYPNDPSRNDEC